MHRFAAAVALVALLFSLSAPAAAPQGKPLTAGTKMSASIKEEGPTTQRRHPFTARRGEQVSFSASFVNNDVDAEGEVHDSTTHGMLWVEDASGARLEGSNSSRALVFSVTVDIPADGTWFLVTSARPPVTYEVEMFKPQPAQVLPVDELLGAGILVDDSLKYFEVNIKPAQEGRRLLLLVNGEFPEKMAVSLVPAPGGAVLPCEGGPCNTRDLIWKAKAGTVYLRVLPAATSGIVLGLFTIPLDTERIAVGRAVEGSLEAAAAKRSFLLTSPGGEHVVGLTATGFDGRLEVRELGKPASELPAEFLDGRARVPFAKGSWILTVGAKTALSNKVAFRLEVAAPKPGPSSADLLGETPKDPVGGNVAFIDVSRMLGELPEGKASQVRLKAMFEASKKQLDEQRAGLQGKKGDEYKAAAAAFEALGRDLQVKLSTENEKATAPLVEKVGRAVRKLRQERGVVVFDANAVAWADSAASLGPAVMRAVTSDAPSPKEPVKTFKVAIVDLQRVSATSTFAKAAQARVMAVEHYGARADKAQQEEAAFGAAVEKALEKLAGARGIGLVLLKDGLEAQYPGLKWKTPPVDLTAEVVAAIDAK